MKPNGLIAMLGIGLGGVLLASMLVLNGGATNQESAPVQQVRVVKSYPHDTGAFSQGLAFDGEKLYEGTGQYGRSQLRRIELETGIIEKAVALGERYFGEGITIYGDRIYQLTWKEQVCVVYDKEQMKPLGTLRYSGEGWGLANDDKYLYMSDGSSTIRVLDPRNMRVVRKFAVREGRQRIDKLNELEVVEGELWANIWYLDRIARIDLEDGQILGWIDCGPIYPPTKRPDREHVLNGIGYDAASGRLLVTGKNWPRVYEIEVLPLGED